MGISFVLQKLTWYFNSLLPYIISPLEQSKIRKLSYWYIFEPSSYSITNVVLFLVGEKLSKSNISLYSFWDIAFLIESKQ